MRLSNAARMTSIKSGTQFPGIMTEKGSGSPLGDVMRPLTEPYPVCHTLADEYLAGFKSKASLITVPFSHRSRTLVLVGSEAETKPYENALSSAPWLFPARCVVIRPMMVGSLLTPHEISDGTRSISAHRPEKAVVLDLRMGLDLEPILPSDLEIEALIHSGTLLTRTFPKVEHDLPPAMVRTLVGSLFSPGATASLEHICRHATWTRNLHRIEIVIHTRDADEADKDPLTRMFLLQRDALAFVITAVRSSGMCFAVEEAPPTQTPSSGTLEENRTSYSSRSGFWFVWADGMRILVTLEVRIGESRERKEVNWLGACGRLLGTTDLGSDDSKLPQAVLQALRQPVIDLGVDADDELQIESLLHPLQCFVLEPRSGSAYFGALNYG